MKIKGKKVKSIEPYCSKENSCCFCNLLGVKKNESFQCNICNMKNKLIVRCEKRLVKIVFIMMFVGI